MRTTVRRNTVEEYAHILDEEGVEVWVGGGGSYKGKESKLRYNGRDVLYVIGGTSTVTSCCGAGLGTCFISVPGFINAWRSRTNEAGVPVSEIEPIVDEESREEIRKALQEQHGIRNIAFW